MSPAAGLGFKPEHLQEALDWPAADLWFEVHAENYMVAGGPRLAMLEILRRERPLSLHGVGLSLAGAADLDREHLAAFRRLVDRFEPFAVSEHLAWSRLGERCFPDLLPVRRTNEALSRLVDNIGQVQDAVGRSIMIENPSHYLELRGHEWSETDFLAELARRSGCGLLIDVNNVMVGAHNLKFDPAEWLASVPSALVGEIHLAGHSLDREAGLSIDSHDQPVSEDVWQLFADFVCRVGARPTLIERDGNLPPFVTLMAERERAQALLPTGGIALAA